MTFSPEKWTTIGNSSINEESVKGGKNWADLIAKVPFGAEFSDGYNEADGAKISFFNQTPSIATYIYAFISGPFVGKEYNKMIPG